MVTELSESRTGESVRLRALCELTVGYKSLPTACCRLKYSMFLTNFKYFVESKAEQTTQIRMRITFPERDLPRRVNPIHAGGK